MRRTLLAVLICTWTGAAAHAQPAIVIRGMAQLRQFLALSDSQVEAILKNNRDQTLWTIEKQRRISQVQFEISMETAKETVDPLALGIRYAEIEATCREIRSQSDSALKKNSEVLTEQQKAKLKILEEAIKLAPVIAEAQAANLLDPSIGSLPSLPSGGSGFADFLLGLPSTGAGCGGSRLPFFDLPLYLRDPFPLGSPGTRSN